MTHAFYSISALFALFLNSCSKYICVGVEFMSSVQYFSLLTDKEVSNLILNFTLMSHLILFITRIYAILKLVCGLLIDKIENNPYDTWTKCINFS